MSSVIASPFGHALPYSALFSVPKKSSIKHKRRPAEYFWKKATGTASIPGLPTPVVVSPGLDHSLSHVNTHSTWLDVESPAVSDSENENPDQSFHVLPKKRSFARFRHIAFRAFVPKPGSNKPSTMVTSELISKQANEFLEKNERGSGFTVFNSWRVKTKGAKTQVKKLVAVVRHRVSSKSPEELKPQTWEDYHRLYAAEQIDIQDPPLPPTEPNDEQPTAYHNRMYMPPRPPNEQTRQLVLNRLGVFGPQAFDPSEDATARAHQRAELADRLEAQGAAPASLDQSWDQRRSSVGTSDMGLDATRAMMAGVRSGDLPPETLEQHPVFRKIVKECRELFGTSISMLTVMDEDRQIFLAESGLGGMREVSRDVTFCAHTILSGRKGFTILDTHKDWRFENGPLVQNFGSRFYAGVPLMAPNLDGASDSDAASCPLGTLCVVDDKPREEFGVEERKKLVYMAEYARRELEKWFLSKMANKLKALEDSRQTWVHQIAEVGSLEGETGEEVLNVGNSSNILSPPATPSAISPRPSRLAFRSTTSDRPTPPTSPSSMGHSGHKNPPRLVASGPSLFEDRSSAIKPKIQKVFDLATKLVGDTLDLSLVYVLAVKPVTQSEDGGRTVILSGYNLPTPTPVFDPGLHLRALRAPEGGLLYQNPALQDTPDSSITGQMTSGSDHYASAMLVSIGSEIDGQGGGFVLAGFTSDVKRVFGGEDVSYLKQFANELARYTNKLRI